jgi:hypothetical protein
MPLLIAIIAKIMGLTEAVLDNWVTAIPAGMPDACTGIYAVNVTVEKCGTDLAGYIAQAVSALVAMVPQILSGLSAQVV